MEMTLLDLNNGVIKINVNHDSFLIDTGKNIEKITSINDLCPDGTLVVECISDGEHALRWINLSEFFHLLHREDIISSFSNISNCVLVA